MRLPARRWRAVVLVVFSLAGVLFVTSAHTARGSNLRASGHTELRDLITDQSYRVKTLNERAGRLRQDVLSAYESEAAQDSRIAMEKERADSLGMPAGMEPVSGPALVVTLNDAPRPRGGVPARGAPDDLVVHQQDVQAVVNALWAGGAESMKLMDQRVISTSAVRCVGNTLILQGRVYSPPYEVTAIGDVERMRAVLDAAPEVQLYRRYVEDFGLVYKVEERRRMTLPGFEGSLDLRYARVTPQ